MSFLRVIVYYHFLESSSDSQKPRKAMAAIAIPLDRYPMMVAPESSFSHSYIKFWE